MQQSSTAANDSKAVCAVAIAARAVVEATYNGTAVELHPHQLIERNDAVYLRAVNPAKSVRNGESASLGLFNLAGLSDLKIVGRAFEPLPSGSLEMARPSDKVIETI